ncbi:MAG: PAS domain S-box protein [Candidatus Melainabacteria bacterium]|nr:PAS domain S-box protein [Candidatus Melainabacteria bacterium]
MSTDIDVSLFKYLVQGVKDYAIFALDPAGYIVSWNPGAQRAKGYTESEVIGKHFSIFYTPDSIAADHPQNELLAALRDGSYEEEGWRLRKSGERFWANVVITALYNEAGTHIGFAKITRDLTERKKSELLTAQSVENLRQTEEVFNLLVSAVKDYAIFIMDPTGHIRTWNAGAQRIKGYLPKEIIGKHFSQFYTEEANAVKHPDFELREAIANGSYEEEGIRIRKDGTEFWASITITTILDGDRVAGFVKVTRDLTERKNYESDLEAARDEAILANQLKSKFVASISHEIRTPLSGIVGLSELISRDDECSADIRQTGGRIFEAAKQLLSILNDLLDFSKLEAGKCLRKMCRLMCVM